MKTAFLCTLGSEALCLFLYWLCGFEFHRRPKLAMAVVSGLFASLAAAMLFGFGEKHT